MKFSFIYLFTFITLFIGEKILAQNYSVQPNDSSDNDTNKYFISYSMPDSIMNDIPFKNQNNINRYFPGVVSYFQNLYIRGGKNEETGFFLDGIKFNDLFTGENSFFINPTSFERIDFYSGLIPNEFGNTSAGLFNYRLRTGSNKIEFDVEHQSDNFTFSNDAFSGKKRLGTYYYGYNETNLNLGGPLYFKNVRFFFNANYLFQKDKNPQSYPGISNINFVDQYHQDSIQIHLPAGIVPFNSFESFNLLSTLFFDFDKIKIKAFGIYFNENEYSERNHILDYLNKRLGLVNHSGGILNLRYNQEINKIFSYSLTANYYYKNEETKDQYLGSNYWAYGDSLANAEAGVSNFYSRYSPPINRHLFIWKFNSPGYPLINYEKSNQERYSLSGNINLNLFKHTARIGGEFSQYTLRNWQLDDQAVLSNYFYNYRTNSEYQEYNDEELKDFLLKFTGVNNYGYDIRGNDSNSGLYKAPKPIFYSVFIDDQFSTIDKVFFYFGLRYDHFNYDFKTLIEPANTFKTFDYQRNIDENGLTNSKNYSFVSPKVWLKYSPFSNLSLAFDYSKNVQSHPFEEIYQGYYSIFENLNNIQSGLPPVKLGNLIPIISNQFQANIYFKPLDNFNLEFNLYEKITDNQTSLEIQEVTLGSIFSEPYIILGNSNSKKIWGSEIIAEYFKEGFNVNALFSYQNAEESKKEFEITPSATISVPILIEPENINTINLNLLMSYNFQHLYKFSNLFKNLNISILCSYNDGHPFTNIVSNINKLVYESGKTPSVNQVDLKIQKSFTAFNNLNFDVFIYVINLFDRKNIFDVFTQSGLADNDGFLNSIEGRATVDQLGESFSQLYKLIELYNPNGGQQIFYGPPRQIGFGIKLNY